MFLAIVFGVGIGSFAGYYGGAVDKHPDALYRCNPCRTSLSAALCVFMFFTDGTPKSVVILIAIFGWTYAARLVRGEFLSLKEREYILASRTIGAKNFRLMFRHMLPNAAGPIIVNATLLIGVNIILESVLSYFGFGIKPPDASWGEMISVGQGLFAVDPWPVLVRGLLIFLTVLKF